ncbi:MAG: hypothetical protein A2932_01475 [Candidatus Spechtbacteria bacterium RIFCSPLOWO2_01_FULL_46_10]|uniref:Uncharacterized protein n=1 Tax=Candidatus Spechtbacteria bacterium RIFCSPLOWO2_01_FULL_46_10 TaxID=1802163 RepID=A0A1G2HH82_9BACT|nr:MAG: hypothetical protein A2932_01475 [Candidatus Spechtbacteria bacterium RIFCSPLOWO2_01_FULL_46_10]
MTAQKIRRKEAENLITEYQKKLLRENNCSSTWELYALMGIGHCCGGIYIRSDVELRQAYRRYLNVDTLSESELVKAVLEFERSQLPPEEEGLLTCKAVEEVFIFCEGLAGRTNVELSEFFSAALGGRMVVD